MDYADLDGLILSVKSASFNPYNPWLNEDRCKR